MYRKEIAYVRVSTVEQKRTKASSSFRKAWYRKMVYRKGKRKRHK